MPAPAPNLPHEYCGATADTKSSGSHPSAPRGSCYHPCLETPRDGGQESWSCHRFHTSLRNSYCLLDVPDVYLSSSCLCPDYRIVPTFCQVAIITSCNERSLPSELPIPYYSRDADVARIARTSGPQPSRPGGTIRCRPDHH